jgi:hypothetical protein
MTAEHPQPPPATAPVTPIASLEDQRVLQILSTEHWSLVSARSLAYNEAFTRGGMFLTFLSTSFVALALLAQAMTFGDQFLTVAAILLAFDFVIGITTYGRIQGANVDDLRAMHGMARIRHAYTQIAPIVSPYFTAATHDDIVSVLTGYGPAPLSGPGLYLYGLTTSGGMIGLIVAMVSGCEAAVLALLAGVSGDLAVWIGLVGGIVTFAVIAWLTVGSVPAHQRDLTAMFPADGQHEDPAVGVRPGAPN